MTQHKISILPILIVNFIGMLGYSIVMPFLIFLVTKFGGNEIIYGLLGSTYPLFQLFGGPFLGKLSDTYGRKKILLISQIGTFIAWTIFTIALLIPIQTITKVSYFSSTFLITIPLILIFFARALDGLTGGNIPVAHAYVADISIDKNRKTNFGFLAMSSSLGAILGPAIAGLLGGTTYKELIPVCLTFTISFMGIFFIIFYLPESKTNLNNINLPKLDFHRKVQTNKTFRGILKIKNIPIFLFIYFTTYLAFSFFYSGFPIFAVRFLHWTVFELGIFFTILSCLMIVVQGPLLSIISQKFNDISLVIIGSGLLVFNFLLLSNNSYIYIAIIFFALGNGLMWPSFMAILSKISSEDLQGTIQGYGNSLGSLANIIGLTLGGYLFSVIGSLTFIFSAIIFLIIFIISLTVKV